MEESKEIKIKKLFRNIYKTITVTFISLLVIISLLFLFFIVHTTVSNKRGTYPKVGLYTIISPSMEPKIKQYDVVLVVKSKRLKVGDVINFASNNKKDTITHRITEITEKNGEKFYKTKGDNNNTEDLELVQDKQIQGRVLFKISKLGTIITKLLTGTGILVICILVILSYLREKSKEEKRIAREDARSLYNIPKYEKEDTIW